MTGKAQIKKSVTKNRRAAHEFHLMERLEAGLELKGTEVKSLRQGLANLSGAFVRIDGTEAFLVGAQIAEYTFGNIMNHDPLRRRKLLLHKREIRRLHDAVRMEGTTIVPLEIYFSGKNAKVEIAIARGKKLHDKRQDLARKEAKRDVEQALRRRR